MSPSFDFRLGDQVEDGSGRWVTGSVVRKRGGYTFRADLMNRHSSTTFQCHSVQLDVDRPFHAEDFAAFLRMVSTGRFETVSRVFGLYGTSGLDSEGAGSIITATAHRVDPCDRDCVRLLQDLTALGDRLDQAHKRQQLSLAFARFSGGY